MKSFLKLVILVLSLILGITYSVFAQLPNQQTPIHRHFSWTYGGHAFSVDCRFAVADYWYYHDLSKLQPYQDYAMQHEGHTYLFTLSQKLDKARESVPMTNYQYAEYLTAFVQQCVPYVADPPELDHDYPRYPIETLVDKGGDCEDKAALLLALLKTNGYDVKMVQFSDHAAVALAHPDAHGSHYFADGKNYFYIETTDVADIGEISPRKAKQEANLHDVVKTASYNRNAQYATNTNTSTKALTPQNVKANETVSHLAYYSNNQALTQAHTTTTRKTYKLADGSLLVITKKTVTYGR